MVRMALGRLRYARANVIGTVLTKHDARKRGRGDPYSYGYGYGYGYGDRTAVTAANGQDPQLSDARKRA